MRSGGKLYILAGGGLAVVAVLLAVMALSGGGGDEPVEETPKATVVQALKDIPANTILTATDVEEKEVPQDQVTADSVQSVAQIVGLTYRRPLVTGERLVVSQTQQPGLSVNIKVGYRAYALPVGEASVLGGLVADNDYVDVVFKTRLNLVRIIPGSPFALPEDEAAYGCDDCTFVPSDMDVPQYPAAGAPGSEYYVRDDVSEASQMEPVAKVLLQDLRVIRVIGPNQTFSAAGVPVEGAEGAAAAPDDEAHGYLVLEVTNQQAEVLSFVQDQRTGDIDRQYQIMVRARDDHAKVTTSGITYQILTASDEYAVPVAAPASSGLTGGAPSTVANDTIAAGLGGAAPAGNAAPTGGSAAPAGETPAGEAPAAPAAEGTTPPADALPTDPTAGETAGQSAGESAPAGATAGETQDETTGETQP